MIHNFNGQNCKNPMPMYFMLNTKEKVLTFATFDIVSPGDDVHAHSFRGTIKEIVEERPARGDYSSLGEVPMFYKVKLF